MDCLFCKMLTNEVHSEEVYSDKKVYGFKDIHPQAKEHYLFIHREHTMDITEMSNEQIQDIFNAIKIFVKTKPSLASGFRLVTNKGDLGGQSVFHTHFHVLGGEQLRRFGT